MIGRMRTKNVNLSKNVGCCGFVNEPKVLTCYVHGTYLRFYLSKTKKKDLNVMRQSECAKPL
jgi:hypothetical protein